MSSPAAPPFLFVGEAWGTLRYIHSKIPSVPPKRKIAPGVEAALQWASGATAGNRELGRRQVTGVCAGPQGQGVSRAAEAHTPSTYPSIDANPGHFQVRPGRWRMAPGAGRGRERAVKSE